MSHSGLEELSDDAPIVAGGRPVPILIQNEESGIFELDEEALASVLLRPGVEDKHVCVLAVAGAFRKGKSFLLDFLLRYCHNRVRQWLTRGLESRAVVNYHFVLYTFYKW